MVVEQFQRAWLLVARHLQILPALRASQSYSLMVALPEIYQRRLLSWKQLENQCILVGRKLSFMKDKDNSAGK